MWHAQELFSASCVAYTLLRYNCWPRLLLYIACIVAHVCVWYNLRLYLYFVCKHLLCASVASLKKLS